MSGGNPAGRGGRPSQSLGLPRPYRRGDEGPAQQDKLEPPKKRLKKDKMNAGTNGNNGFASSTSSSDNETNGVNGEHKKEKKKMNKRDQERIPNKRLSRIFSKPVFSLLSFI